MLDLLDDQGNLTHLGSSRLVFDYTPEWARFIAKALYGVVEGAIRIAAVLCMSERPFVGKNKGAGLQPKGVMQVIQYFEQIKEGLTQSDLPRGTRRSPPDKYYGTLLVHALWEGFHMQVMLRDHIAVLTVGFAPAQEDHHRRKPFPAMDHTGAGGVAG